MGRGLTLGSVSDTIFLLIFLVLYLKSDDFLSLNNTVEDNIVYVLFI